MTLFFREIGFEFRCKGVVSKSELVGFDAVTFFIRTTCNGEVWKSEDQIVLDEKVQVEQGKCLVFKFQAPDGDGILYNKWQDKVNIDSINLNTTGNIKAICIYFLLVF